MDAVSVVSSASLSRSIDFHTKTIGGGKGGKGGKVGGGGGGGMVQKKWSNMDGRRPSYDISQRSEVSTGTDLSAERPTTRDTNSLFMRDASVLSGQPDKSNFREKMQSWAVYEDSSSPYMAPRPTTSLADQKPSGSLSLMNDIDREMSFLMSRPSTTFPSKPKELVEPLEGIMPDERPVSQKKFLVLPSIGRRQQRDFLLRRQRSNLETVNQLDYSRSQLDESVNFLSDYYYPSNSSPQGQNHRRQKQGGEQHQHDKHHYQSHHQHHHRHHHHHHHQATHQQCYSDDEGDSDCQEDQMHCQPPHFMTDPRESPTKSGKVGTPMPLPPIHKLKLDRLRAAQAGLTQLEEEHAYALHSSRLSQAYDDEDEDDDDDDEDDLEEFRLKTPDTFRSESPTKPATFTPPLGFR